MTIRLRKEAQEALQTSWAWYEARRDGLGDQFIACVEAAIHAAARAPLQYPRLHERLRRVLVRRFPYQVIFVERPNGIDVLAVLHTRRDPDVWRKKLRDT